MNKNETQAQKISLFASNHQLNNQNPKGKNNQSDNDERMSCSTLKNQLEFSLASSKQQLANDSLIGNISAVLPCASDGFSKNDDSLLDSPRMQKKFVLQQNFSFSKPSSYQDQCSPRNVRKKLFDALIFLSEMKRQVDDLRDQVKLESKRNYELILFFSKKSSAIQQQPKIMYSDSFRIACENLTEVNKQLLQRVTVLENENDNLQKQHAIQINSKEKQLIRILNDFHQTKVQNNNLNSLLEREKDENIHLQEQLFNLRQQQKGIQLQVESRVQKYIKQYQKNSELVSKTQYLRNSFRTFQEQPKKPSKISSNCSSRNSVYPSPDFDDDKPNIIKISSPTNSNQNIRHLSQVLGPSTKSSFLSPVSDSVKSKTTSNILFPHSAKVSRAKNHSMREKYQPNSSLGMIDGRLKEMKNEINRDIQHLKSKYK